MLNAPGASQYRPLSQPLHFVRGEGPSAVFENEKIGHMEERLHAIEGGGSYGFADM